MSNIPNYETKQCPSCEGLGGHPIGPTFKCGRCNGTGVVNFYYQTHTHLSFEEAIEKTKDSVRELSKTIDEFEQKYG